MARPYNDRKIEEHVIKILRSGKLVQGEVAKEFETALAGYIGCRNVISLNSGTAALHSAITALKMARNDRNQVITTPLSFAATANSVVHSGCELSFVDVDEETFNIDPTLVREKITNKTLAVEPVDVYGLPADLESIGKIAKSAGSSVVEDAAEAIGANFNGKKVGSISTISCFSTYATKNLHTGEGGFVTTDDDSLAEKVRLIRNQGQVVKYNQVVMGYNFRMLEFCAAIGLAQIPILDKLNAKRRENALFLREQLGPMGCFEFQRVDKPNEHAWYMFAAKLDERRAGMKRDLFLSKLREKGVDADVAWPTPIHLQPYYREAFGYKEGDFPSAERICKSIFQIPVHPLLAQQEVERVVSGIRDVLK